MVEEQLFARRIGALLDFLKRLERFRGIGEGEFLADPDTHHLAERYLHLATQAAIDLVNHWISFKGLTPAATSKEAFRTLSEAGEIDAQLARRLEGWVGFRNILVHQYIDIDHRVSYRSIQSELDDLKSIASWAATKLEPLPGS